jgi:hypothetical protein
VSAHAIHQQTDSPMQDDPSKPDERPARSQPPVPLTLAVFVASVLGFMVVVIGLFALMRYIGRAH